MKQLINQQGYNHCLNYTQMCAICANETITLYEITECIN